MGFLHLSISEEDEINIYVQKLLLYGEKVMMIVNVTELLLTNNQNIMVTANHNGKD